MGVELSATWFSEELQGIYEKPHIFFADFGLQKSFLKNKFEMLISFNDFLRINRYRGHSLTDYANYDYLPYTPGIPISKIPFGRQVAIECPAKDRGTGSPVNATKQ